MFKINNNETRTTTSASIVNSEQANFSWDSMRWRVNFSTVPKSNRSSTLNESKLAHLGELFHFTRLLKWFINKLKISYDQNSSRMDQDLIKYIQIESIWKVSIIKLASRI